MTFFSGNRHSGFSPQLKIAGWTRRVLGQKFDRTSHRKLMEMASFKHVAFYVISLSFL
jgi:hypothetical protein